MTQARAAMEIEARLRETANLKVFRQHAPERGVAEKKASVLRLANAAGRGRSS